MRFRRTTPPDIGLSLYKLLILRTNTSCRGVAVNRARYLGTRTGGDVTERKAPDRTTVAPSERVLLRAARVERRTLTLARRIPPSGAATEFAGATASGHKRVK